VMPTHCTVETAIRRLQEVFGAHCLTGGAGRVVQGRQLYE
jgi:metal-dependent hydrolase (beta-lactamase superfamily II)